MEDSSQMLVGAHLPQLRLLLSVPGNRTDFMIKAESSIADTITLDLEDSIFPEHKQAARSTVVDGLARHRWQDKRMLVRINALDTPWALDDLLAIAACDRLDGIMLPKVETLGDLIFIDRLLAHCERQRIGRPRLELHILIESALGLANVESLVHGSPRLASVTFGPGDYAMSIGTYSLLFTEAGKENRWSHARHRIANACHASGIVPLDGPSFEMKDMNNLASQAADARSIGFGGKWALSPLQLKAIDTAFRPSSAEVEWAKRCVHALREAEAAGRGTGTLDGRLIEAATMKVAKHILASAGTSGQSFD